jgi:hypothetical protein
MVDDHVIYRPIFRLVLSSLESSASVDSGRAYAVVIDPASQSGVYIDGLPWASPYVSGPQPRFVPGNLGVASLHTGETMQGHSASLSLSLGPVGQLLRSRVLPHDPLRIELLRSDGAWVCAFDGYLSSVQITRASMPDSYRWRMDIAAVGVHKIFSEQWLDWQGLVRAGSSKDFFGPGFSFYQELAKQQGQLHVSDLLKMFITGAVDRFLDFGVRGFRAASGSTFQTSPNARDWQTAWNLFLFSTGGWYLMQQGPLWGIFQGLAEHDIHEFFITYQQDPTAPEYREIPTIVLRPRPWPGPPASAVTGEVSGAPADDDSIWRQLEVIRSGVPGGVPAALRVGTARQDGARSNAFFVSMGGASTGSPAAMNMAKAALGCRIDESLVKRYGFSSRQVSIGDYYRPVPEYFTSILPAVLDRVAWQDAPLPFLLDQTRGFPLIPGMHVGCVLEDYSESASSPTTGYVISVSHSISGSPQGLQAETVVGTTRGIEGVTAEQYPAAARALVNLQKVSYLDGAGMKAARDYFADQSHYQPAPLAPAPGPDNLLVTNRPDLQDQPTPAVWANLALLQNHISRVRDLLGAITLTSVYRSEKLNAAFGGRVGSAHTKGLAFDFQVPGGGAGLFAAFEKLQADAPSLGYQLIVFETRRTDGVQWIHYEIPAAGGKPALRATDGSMGD